MRIEIIFGYFFFNAATFAYSSFQINGADITTDPYSFLIVT